MNLFPLDTFPYEFPGNEIKINFEITEFTAICPFSDFPDFATIRLEYVPNERCVELKSLKLYINSFRNIKIFHEHVINIILEDFVAACDPLSVEIEGDFHVRGNIKTVVQGCLRQIIKTGLQDLQDEKIRCRILQIMGAGITPGCGDVIAAFRETYLRSVWSACSTMLRAR